MIISHWKLPSEVLGLAFASFLFLLVLWSLQGRALKKLHEDLCTEYWTTGTKWTENCHIQSDKIDKKGHWNRERKDFEISSIKGKEMEKNEKKTNIFEGNDLHLKIILLFCTWVCNFDTPEKSFSWGFQRLNWNIDFDTFWPWFSTKVGLINKESIRKFRGKKNPLEVWCFDCLTCT